MMYHLIYGFLYLFSLLPFRILYFISDVIYAILYYVTGYRKKVVLSNLAIAFPDKTEKERIRIAKDFYHNLLDSFVETIKQLSISEKAFDKRCTGNFEDANDLASSGKIIQFHSGHQFNWEYANWIFAKKLKIPWVVVYMPVENKAVDKIFYKLRAKFGTVLVSAKNYRKDMLAVSRVPHALALVADQKPGDPTAAHWLNFFTKPAAFISGPDKGAVKKNTGVAFVNFNKIKRGHYDFEIKVISQGASEFQIHDLTRMYRDFLEECIYKQPANYLWSHKRWKYNYKAEYDKLWIDYKEPAKEIN